MAYSGHLSNKICTKCNKCLPFSEFYTKGVGRYSSSCRACELARKKKQWLKKSKKNKRQKSVRKTKKAIEVSSSQIKFIGTPQWGMVQDYLKDLIDGIPKKRTRLKI